MTRSPSDPPGPAPPAPPSALFLRQLPALRAAARLGPVLDLACGRGRHARAAAAAGLPICALDRNAGFLEELTASAPDVDCVRFDLEAGLAPPFRDGAFGAVLVFRYLHRPLAPALERLLAPGGLLVYETFTTGQLALGSGPKNPDFLLEPGELPRLFPGLEACFHEEGLQAEGTSDAAVTARFVARKS